MQIEHPYYLVALVVIPFIIWIYRRFSLWRNRSLQRFGEWRLVSQLIPNHSSSRPIVKFVLLIVGFTLIIAALSNIKYGDSKRIVKHEGIDVAVVLDVSLSMLAEDAPPNRLEAAKLFANKLIDNLPDARIALITFSAVPVTQTPLTVDHSAAQLILYNVSAEHAPSQGTDIGAAITEALKALPENQHHYRAIVLISDGEDWEGSVDQALDDVANEQLIICTVGVGTEKGASIPMPAHGITAMKKDATGNAVITTLRSAVLNTIAERNNGVFVQIGLGRNDPVDDIVHRLDQANQSVFDEELLVNYESKFQWFLFPALALLIIDLFISNRKPLWINSLFGKTNKS
ncbi:MAG: VWA domain-containing protein [Chitinophagales bacterium]|nr:VWA domain-containing protein [Chitinophagales bacterium]